MSPVSNTAGERRTKATMGLSRKSSSPTKTLEASAPSGIFFMKCMSTLVEKGEGQTLEHATYYSCSAGRFRVNETNGTKDS